MKLVKRTQESQINNTTKTSKIIKVLSIIACLTIGLFSACGLETPTCQTCGFNGNEQVQDVNGGGLYSADSNGCVTIQNSGGGGCSRFDLQPLSGAS
jgi:hypothetical protein